MMVALLILGALCVASCVLFSQDIKACIGKIFSTTAKWAPGDQRVKPPNAGRTLIGLLIFAGLCVVASGNYMVVLHNLAYALTIQRPVPIALAFVVLAGILGVGIHITKGKARVAAGVLVIGVLVMFSGLAYVQMAEDMRALDQIPGNQPFIAAGLFGLLTALEIFSVWLLLTLIEGAVGYLWLALLGVATPLGVFYVIAWVSCAAKDAPGKIKSWKADRWQHGTQLYVDQSSLREQAAEEAMQREPRETEADFVRRCEESKRRTAKSHLNTLSRVHGITTAGLTFFMLFISLLRSPRGAYQLFTKIKETLQNSFDHVLAQTRARFNRNGGTGNEEKEDPGMKLNLWGALLIPLAMAQGLNAQESEERRILIFLDVTASYSQSVTAIRYTADHIIRQLAPGDVVTFFALGNPQENASLQIRFPSIRTDLVESHYGNVFEYMKAKQQFDTVISKTDSLRRVARRWLLEELKLQERGSTWVHSMLLEYASIQFNASKGTKILIAASDMLNEASGQPRTRLPPSIQVDLTDVDVSLIFTPHEDYQTWQTLNSSWSEYMKQAGVARFRMLDVASSAIARDVLPRSSSPSEFPRFRVANGGG